MIFVVVVISCEEFATALDFHIFGSDQSVAYKITVKLTNNAIGLSAIINCIFRCKNQPNTGSRERTEFILFSLPNYRQDGKYKNKKNIQAGESKKIVST